MHPRVPVTLLREAISNIVSFVTGISPNGDTWRVK